MYRSLFHHELGLMIRSKKNVFFIVFLFIALLGYCLIMLPDKQTVHVLDHEQLKADIQLNEVLLDYRLREGYTGFNSFTKKSFYAELQYYNQLSSKLIHAYENGDPNRYLRLKMEYDLFFYTVTSDPSMFEGSTYPRMDMMHFEYYTYHRYQALLHNDLPLTFSMIEQKSAIQVFEHLLLVGGPLILFLAIYFSSDILLRDRRHPTIKQGLPIGWYSTMNIKSGVAFLYTLAVIVGLSAFGLALLTLLNGFGDLSLQIPYLESFNDVTMEQYEYKSMSTFLLQAIALLAILLFVFIRINMVFSLLFKKEWLVLGVTTCLLLFERLFRDRTSDTVLGIDVGYLPQIYFDFGKVAAGEMNYLFLTDSISFTTGMVALLGLVVVVEALLLVISKVISKQRFYS